MKFDDDLWIVENNDKFSKFIHPVFSLLVDVKPCVDRIRTKRLCALTARLVLWNVCYVRMKYSSVILMYPSSYLNH
jgi:hypothetical protein